MLAALDFPRGREVKSIVICLLGAFKKGDWCWLGGREGTCVGLSSGPSGDQMCGAYR